MCLLTILDWHYKIKFSTDHCANFHACLPTNLGYLVLEATLFGFKDPSSNTLHVKPIFDSPLNKNCKEPSIPAGNALVRPNICFFKKCVFRGYNSTSRSPRLLDRTSPDLVRLTREESLSKTYLSDFEYIHPLRRYSPPKFKFFWGRPPIFRTGIIKMGLVLTIVQNFTPLGPRISEISRSQKNIWAKT